MAPDKEMLWRKAIRQTGAREDRYGPRLTLNPSRASVIHLPREGRKLTRNDKDFSQWQKRLTC